jgi:hypothetical protein
MFEGGLAAAADTVVFHFTGEASDIVDGLDLFLPGLQVVAIELCGADVGRVDHPFEADRLVNPFVDDGDQIDDVSHIYMDIFLVEPEILFGKFRGDSNGRSGEVCLDEIPLVNRKESSGGSDDPGCRSIRSWSGMVGKTDPVLFHVSEECFPFFAEVGMLFIPV